MAPVLRKVRRVTGCLVGELLFMSWCIGERRGEASTRNFDCRGPGRNPWADCSVANRKRQISSPTARVAQRRGTTLRASPVPVRIRPRAPFHSSRKRTQRAQCNFPPSRSLRSFVAIYFLESKPQQTGTGLLIRVGEVATTSGSTKSKMPGRLTRRTPPFEGGRAGANPAPAANPYQPVSSKSERLSYKQRTLESYQHGLPTASWRNQERAGL